MMQETDFSNPINRAKMSVLIAVTVSAIGAFLLFICAALGSELAMNSLMNLTLPRFNVFANFLPVDLSEVNNGLQLALGVVILQSALFLSVVIFFAWSFMRKD